MTRFAGSDRGTSFYRRDGDSPRPCGVARQCRRQVAVECGVVQAADARGRGFWPVSADCAGRGFISPRPWDGLVLFVGRPHGATGRSSRRRSLFHGRPGVWGVSRRERSRATREPKRARPAQPGLPTAVFWRSALGLRSRVKPAASLPFRLGQGAFGRSLSPPCRGGRGRPRSGGTPATSGQAGGPHVYMPDRPPAGRLLATHPRTFCTSQFPAWVRFPGMLRGLAYGQQAQGGRNLHVSRVGQFHC